MNPISFIYNQLIYRPLFNGLVLIYHYLPLADLGLAVIIFTVLIRLLILPLTQKSLTAQKKMAVLQPKIKEIQDKHKDNKEEQTKKLMELYKEHGANPFSGCLLVALQLPVFFALFSIFRTGLSPGSFTLLYKFVPAPQIIGFMFLGLVDLSRRSIALSLCAGLTQFIQGWLMPMPQASPSSGTDFMSEFGKAMQSQTKYIIPVVITFASLSLPSALALFWTISNLFAIVQQVVVNRKDKKDSR